MKIVRTCPRCGADLLVESIDIDPPVLIHKCLKCGWSHSEQEQVLRIPFGENPLEFIENNILNTSEEQ